MGQVQGVGFRPFIMRLACQSGVTGFVRNESSRVIIEAQGLEDQLKAFAAGLLKEAPTCSRIDRISARAAAVHPEETTFVIAESEFDGDNRPTITPDLALCPQCLTEIRDVAERRHSYGLTNCTECGPRYSIIVDTPYDRAHTTMRHFELCEICHQQYLNPADRRYHAQPIACAQCGPQVNWVSNEPDATVCHGVAGIAAAAQALAAGQTIAIKGLGGYHLAARADEETPVALLRRRKHRDAKPFALMVADIAAAEALVELSSAGREALAATSVPIVLARRKRGAVVASSVAPGAHRLGVMLAYTPLQHLLFDELKRISATGEAPPLVMTSANLCDEPLIKDDAEALGLLGALCDGVLLHEREIERCVDDSVILDLGDMAPLPMRRSRGFAPRPVALPARSAGLCVGGELKNTVALVREGEAILSQHLGDLKHPRAFAHFRAAIDDFCRLFRASPQWIAHDLHPAYLSTEYARSVGERLQAPLIAVQHHHAHAASVLAEHSFVGEALAIVCDGVGYGSDGTIWGGELLRVDMAAGSFERVASLPPFPLPGGDAGARETRRSAAGLLQALGGAAAQRGVERLYPEAEEREQMQRVLSARVNCPLTSAAGRWFDAVAAIVGAATENRYEGEAPMRLEALASQARATGVACPGMEALPADMRQLIAAALDRMNAHDVAMRFHELLASAFAGEAVRAAQRLGLKVVGLSGGCFCNALLTELVSAQMNSAGLVVLRHEVVPPNDGGLALGQAAVASALAAQKGWC
jgi:hydrogenase maturation protein HypF